MRVSVGDLVSYRFGDVNIVGIVLEACKTIRGGWGGPKPPEFTMKLFELDSYVSVWDVWPSDVIVIHSEARRSGQN